MIELSIIIPIYNVEEYLDECLESVYKIKNIKKEVLLINDGSTDNSIEIIKKYKELYFEETIVINKKNEGLSATRNLGIENSKGKYITFLDSDDFINTRELESLYFFTKKNDLDVGIGNGIYFPKIEKIFKGKYEEKLYKGLDFFCKMLEKNDYLEIVVAKIYKKEFLLKNKLKFIEKIYHEDTPFTFEVLLKAKKVMFYDLNIYVYRKREMSITSKKTKKHIIDKIIGFHRSVDEYSKYKKNNEQEINLTINNYFFDWLWFGYKDLNKVDKNLFFKVLRLKKFTVKRYIKILIMLFEIYIKQNIIFIKD